RMDEMLKAYPNSSLVPSALYEKGVALEHAGKNKEAVNVFNKLITTYPGKEEARKGLLQLALVQNSLNNQDAAIEAYKKVIKQAPTSDEAKVAAEDLKSIYADRGELNDFAKFLKTVPNAPQLNVSDVDRLTFESAEKAAVAAKPSITKMQEYLNKYPNGAYTAQAHYYVGRYAYEKGNLNDALTSIDKALNMGADASFAEDALAMKSDILNRQGKTQEAIEVYKQIVDKSSSDDNKVLAQLGILRSSMKLEKWKDVTATADALLKNHTLSASEEGEVKLARAIAAARQGKGSAAEADLKALAKDANTKTGAQATYELAKLQYEAGSFGAAEKTINNFFKAKSQQTYWIGKCYILLADVYHKQGKNAEAREYLEGLKANYPGNEQDIKDDINSRLSKWGAKNQPAEQTGKARNNKNNNSSADNKSGSSKKSNKK
ncbi:MAG: tetratricopeptide repeat protein, partial [Muribaculaceae bacterium]|nr:tetratricopeptide repeat protein [Muribaculaceae bacterium]